MNRRLVPCLVFTLCLSVAASAQTGKPSPSQSSTPPWLPRSALLGTYINKGALVPEARVQWELVFFKSRTDALALLIEPLAAAAVDKPDTVIEGSNVPMTSLQLYSLLLGVGYRSRRESGVEWGFQIGTGPAWYKARFRGTTRDEESYVVGLLDGRAHLGYRFGPVSLGLAVGYGDPYNYRRASLARPYVGGFQLGLYADWR
jgi:hypothetical protein